MFLSEENNRFNDNTSEGADGSGGGMPSGTGNPAAAILNSTVITIEDLMEQFERQKLLKKKIALEAARIARSGGVARGSKGF